MKNTILLALSGATLGCAASAGRSPAFPVRAGLDVPAPALALLDEARAAIETPGPTCRPDKRYHAIPEILQRVTAGTLELVDYRVSGTGNIVSHDFTFHGVSADSAVHVDVVARDGRCDVYGVGLVVQ